MHPETHLAMYRVHNAELRRHTETLRLARRAARRQALRSRLGWTMIGLGLRLIPAGVARPARTPRTA
ncbi:hypothetical protein E6R18_18765 [Streptomyces sp. A1277]|uniref:hypothetical protein n=1 Tax=Streptomyces sp. A1277 TaxID=2563103 RepID=UPI0010A22E2C|nr:hypothetical protein [Streptomyces sp. A1277]THA30833.1 hypothetical protein E6R18_18765 [Streptomyces sp. A1277]